MKYRFIPTTQKVSKTEWGIISSNGDVLLPFEYDEIDDLKPGYDCFTVKKTGKMGIVDLDFKIRIPCIYDSILPLGNGLFKVGKKSIIESSSKNEL